MRTNPELKLAQNGKYEIRWSEKTGEKWRSKRKSTGTDDYTQAVTKLSEFLTIRPVRDRDYTVREVVDHYLRHHSKPRGNDTTDRNVLRAPLEAFGDWPAKSLNDIEVENYSRLRMAGKYGPKAVKSPTVRREIVALQAALNFAVRRDLIKGGRKYSFPKPKDSVARDRWITEAQQEDILSRLGEAPLDVQIFIRIGLTYGVRKGAILDLRFGEQIDFLTGTINFNPPGRVETRKRRPVVPMTKTIRSDLEMMFKAKRRGARVCETATPKRFARFMEDIGYGWVTCHTLKHSAITLMLRAGVSPGDVSKLTATDIKTIFKIYRHHSADELMSIAEGRGI